MTVDSSGNEIVPEAARKVYETHDKTVDEYIEATLRVLRELPTPKPHTLPPGTDRMRYAAIERAFMSASHTLYREFHRWKEGRS